MQRVANLTGIPLSCAHLVPDLERTIDETRRLTRPPQTVMTLPHRIERAGDQRRRCRAASLQLAEGGRGHHQARVILALGVQLGRLHQHLLWLFLTHPSPCYER